MTSMIPPIKYTLLLLGICYALNAGAANLSRAIPGNNASKTVVEDVSKRPMVDSFARKEIQNLQTSVENTKSLSQIAGLIISWTGIIFTIFSVIIVLSSIYAGIQIREIRKTKEEIKDTLVSCHKYCDG